MVFRSSQAVASLLLIGNTMLRGDEGICPDVLARKHLPSDTDNDTINEVVQKCMI